ncbi:putative serine-TYPE carboxypeptidase F precursor [Apodospora peruviana]|uniref:Carboxypeptidase n=1 Tax=Apodospora peruviana TaxID=516989 RepID=A0AAE0MFK3_9PEZI|nr:putative serine-TYPE carboxypeptidase F precursor [Apodospora peruviana]
MKVTFTPSFVSLSGVATVALACDSNYLLEHARRRGYASDKMQLNKQTLLASIQSNSTAKISNSPFLNKNIPKFLVNGTAIPEVSFDAGESYAGNINVGNSTDNALFFWFWPTTDSNPEKSIIIWLNGGVAPSRMLVSARSPRKERPVSLATGTKQPVRNPWSWHCLTNIVYIEQPIGTGFSYGTPTAANNDDVAEQFMLFWKNFIDTFNMYGYRVYVTGESYAGLFCPYIASHFLDANDTTYFDVRGIDIPAAYYVDYWSNVVPINDSAKAYVRNVSASCGYDDYMERYLTFQASGPQPVYATLEGPSSAPFLKIPFVPSYLDIGSQPYFNRNDVRKAIHAPAGTKWHHCTGVPVFVNYKDESETSIVKVLPHVIDATKNVIISHAINDMLLIANGTLLAIQNMTWGGQLGFQSLTPIASVCPAHLRLSVMLSGHQTPLWQAALTFRQIEVLLGRVSNMSSTTPFIPGGNGTDPYAYGGAVPKQPGQNELGRGIGPIMGKGAAEKDLNGHSADAEADKKPAYSAVKLLKSPEVNGSMVARR